MSRNWKRYISLRVEDSKGKSLDLSKFKIRFRVQHAETGFPKNAEIFIFNLATNTELTIQKEGKYIYLDCGYEDKHGEIFAGEIMQARRGRESPTDTYIAVVARDSDLAHTHAVVNKVLPKGSTQKDVAQAAIDAMKEYRVAAGFIADLGSKGFPRPRVLFGKAADILRGVGAATQTSWHIESGKVNIVKNQGSMPNSPVVYNSLTGLIGRGEQTIMGIHARVLINSELKVLGKIKIDQKSINQAAYSPTYGAEVYNQQFRQTGDGEGGGPGNLSLAEDGIYKILTIDHVGDTHGPPWYTDLVCVKADGTIPIAQGARLLVPGGAGEAPDPASPVNGGLGVVPNPATPPKIEPSTGRAAGPV